MMISYKNQSLDLFQGTNIWVVKNFQKKYDKMRKKAFYKWGKKVTRKLGSIC